MDRALVAHEMNQKPAKEIRRTPMTGSREQL